jgi:serine/threonine protein kinase
VSVADLLSVDYGRLAPMTKLGDGAQATIYRTAHRLPGRGGLVYKEFTPDCRADLDLAVLADLIGWHQDLQDPALSSLGAWPLRLVTRGGGCTGFLMPEASPIYSVDLALVKGKQQRRLFEVQHLLNAEHVLAERKLDIHDRWRLEFLRDVAGALSRLHTAGLAVGDFSPKNLLASLVGEPRCFFLDCDSVSLHGRSVLPQFETPDWQAPDQLKATEATDSFKFGLLAIRLFGGDQSLRDPQALHRVGGRLVDLAARSLYLEGARRPAAADWLPALAAAMEGAATRLPTPQVRPAAARVTNTGQPRGTRPGSLPPLPPAPPPTRPVRAGRPHTGRWVLAAAAAVLAVIVCVVNPTWRAEIFEQNQDPAAQLQDSESAAQASAVSGVLSASALDRGQVQQGVKALRDCTGVAHGRRELTEAVKGRAKALQAAKALTVDKLDDGEELQSQLVLALSRSEQADKKYLAWAKDRQHRNCSQSSLITGDYSEANRLSQQAGTAKSRVAQLWAPIAADYEFSTYGRDDI